MKGFLQVTCVVLLFLVLFCLWWSVASNYDYGGLAGTYVFHGKGETCSLHLYADRTFDQELRRGSEIRRAHGHWHRFGESGVSFPNEFSRLSGEELNGSGEAYGWFQRALGLFPALEVAPSPGGLRFHRSLFR